MGLEINLRFYLFFIFFRFIEATDKSIKAHKVKQTQTNGRRNMLSASWGLLLWTLASSQWRQTGVGGLVDWTAHLQTIQLTQVCCVSLMRLLLCKLFACYGGSVVSVEALFHPNHSQLSFWLIKMLLLSSRQVKLETSEMYLMAIFQFRLFSSICHRVITALPLHYYRVATTLLPRCQHAL